MHITQPQTSSNFDADTTSLFFRISLRELTQTQTLIKSNMFDLRTITHFTVWANSVERHSIHNIKQLWSVTGGDPPLAQWEQMTNNRLSYSPAGIVALGTLPGLPPVPVARGPPQCADRFPSCPKRSARGECHTHPKDMLVNCPASCGSCLPTGQACLLTGHVLPPTG